MHDGCDHHCVGMAKQSQAIGLQGFFVATHFTYKHAPRASHYLISGMSS